MYPSEKLLKKHVSSCTYDDFNRTFGHGIPCDDESYQCMDGCPADNSVEVRKAKTQSGNTELEGKRVYKVFNNY